MESYPITPRGSNETFQLRKGEYTHVAWPPGMGKTHAMYSVLLLAMIERKRVVYVMPNHDLIREFTKKLSLSHVHLLGKEKCDCKYKEELWKANCRGCERERDCEYPRLMREALGARVVFMVPQHLFLITKIKPDIVIVDESLENVIGGIVQRQSWLDKYIKTINVFNCRECLSTRCPFKNRRERDCAFFLREVELVDISIDDISTNQQYFLSEAARKAEHVLMDKKNIYMKFNIAKFFEGVETVIFNCATTPTSVAEKFFGKPLTRLALSKPLKNKVVVVDQQGTIKQSRKFDLLGFMRLFGIPNDERTLVVTKKSMEDEYPWLNTKITHYGVARGTNKFEKCENVILVVRLAMKSHERDMISRMNGFDASFIEKSEMLQALHRIRPLYDENKRIFLLTNEVPLDGFSNVERLPPRVLKHALEVYRGKKTLHDVNKNIRKKVRTLLDKFATRI